MGHHWDEEVRVLENQNTRILTQRLTSCVQVDHERYVRGLLHGRLQNRGQPCRTILSSSQMVLTPAPQQKGYTVILVPRQDAVSTKAVKTAYSSTAGTSYVTFDGARAPVANTLGKVGSGMQVVLSNFNHERWMIVCTSLSAQRRIVEECLKWTAQRVAFGRPLNAQPVVRARLANMIARVEAGQNWLEFVTHQMNNVSRIESSGVRGAAWPALIDCWVQMSYDEQSDKIAGTIGLLKQCVIASSMEGLMQYSSARHADISPAPGVRLRKTRRSYLVAAVSLRRAWASSSRTYVYVAIVSQAVAQPAVTVSPDVAI